jgi:uncharacterized membrane protein
MSIIIGLFGIFGLPIIFTDWFLKFGWLIAIPFGILNLITVANLWEYAKWAYYLAFPLIILNIILLLVFVISAEIGTFFLKVGLVLIGFGMLRTLNSKDIRKFYLD